MNDYSTNVNDYQRAYNLVQKITAQTSKVIIGKDEVVKMTIAAMLASGHVLFDDIPGVGKTTLVRGLARAIGLDFTRIQFTPDLMPADILGTSIFNQNTNKFSFHQGPIFSTVVLADEINRATPRTQSALLEAMSDYSVTVDDNHFDLNPDFFVLGTQNPLAFEGTYPLPEAQLDRFLMRLTIGYPDVDDEFRLIYQTDLSDHIERVQEVASTHDIHWLKGLVKSVHLANNVATYVLNLVQATRNQPEIKLGISPRGTLALVQAAKAYAVTNGENYVSPETVQQVLLPVFSHRIILEDEYVQTIQPEEILQEIVAQVEIPVH
ncbi:AAA family ATPase [Xylocopilactobacillus apicola]|uniref:MoxR-like ATPase n=1 Tax=Xylocopilactobacillus apicola TaxID=2932184 RepID=A0AAU9DDN1_9LACO|nr:MoxR family ATPase [Xylocopilactobacillus apicola]BDR57915.1 MoxR-like ATPase [Xylocopilactobacillus apicola]